MATDLLKKLGSKQYDVTHADAEDNKKDNNSCKDIHNISSACTGTIA